MDQKPQKRNRIKVLVIVGPTASGKTALGIELAKKLDGEIISADSRQVYRGLDIGTGKDKSFSQHLIDVADIDEDYNVSHFVRDAKKAIKDITARGKLPIIVGGTGFWIDALIYNKKLPDVKPDPILRAKLEKLSTEKLFEKLKKLDPARAEKIDRHNRRRLVRAIEITNSETPSSSPQGGAHSSPSGRLGGVIWIGIKIPKEELKKRIEKRIDQWLAQGLVEETKKLAHPEKFGFMYAGLSRDEMVQATMQYAKRQTTWFKRNKEIRWITTKKALAMWVD